MDDPVSGGLGYSPPMLMLLCLLGLSALAEEPDPSTPRSEDATETIVITATRGETSLATVARAIEVVSEAQIADQLARTLPEALEATPGVWMQSTNRGAGSPFLRGLTGPQNLVLLDGVPHNLSTYRTGPNQYLSLLDPMGAAQVEVVRGPSSVLYGNGAMGGVIQVIPQAPLTTAGAWDARTTALGTSADRSLSGHGQVRVGFGRVGLLLGGGYADLGSLRVGGGATEPLSAFQQASGRARLRIQPHADHTVDAAYYGQGVLDAGRTDALGEGEVRFYDNRDHLAYLRYRFGPPGAQTGWRPQTAQVTLAAHRAVEAQDRYRCQMNDADTAPADLDACLDRSPDTLDGESLREDAVNAGILTADMLLSPLPGERLQLRLGGEGQLEQVASTRQDREDPGGSYVEAERGNFSPGSRYGVGGVFAHAEVTLAERGAVRTRLQGGGRLSHFQAHAEAVPLPNDAGEAVSQTVDYAFTGGVGAAGLSVGSPRWGAWGSLLQGFRAPNLEETTIFGPEESRFSIPNDALRPERSDTLEVGVQVRPGAWSGRVVGWATRIQDALDDAAATFDGETESAEGLAYSQRVNVDGSRYQGIEGQVTIAPERLSWLALSGDLSWTRGEVDDDGEVVPARRVPPLFGGAGLRLAPPTAAVSGWTWWTTATVRTAGDQTRLNPGDLDDLRICAVEPFTAVTYADQGATCPGSPGWTRLDVHAGARWGEVWSLTVGVNNLLDARYRLHGSGIDAPGIDARAALQARWGRGG